MTPDDAILSASWLSPFVVSYISTVSAIPYVAVRKILQHVAGPAGFNAVRYFDRVDHNSRQVVIPSPDFLYSSVALDLPGGGDIVHIRAPFTVEYASLGVYDDNGRCIHIISHPGQEMDAVIVGSNVHKNDAEIKSAVPPECRGCTSIVRLQSTRSLLLHRLFVPDPSLQDKYRETQHSIKCTFISLPETACSSSKRGSSSFYSRAAAIGVVVAVEGTAVRQGLVSPPRLLIILVSAVVIGLIFAFITLKVLKNPKFAGFANFTKHHHLSDWKFHTIAASPNTSSSGGGGVGIAAWMSQPFHHLVTFLHGALALLPSEVLYGTAFTDADDDMLQYGGAYLIRCPSLDLDSLWWSITLYGDDLFLIENPDNIYSVNSFQLRPFAADVAAHGSVNVLCSRDRPSKDLIEKHRIRYWIPLPHRPTSTGGNPEMSSKKSVRDSSVAPRLILRGNINDVLYSYCKFYLFL